MHTIIRLRKATRVMLYYSGGQNVYIEKRLFRGPERRYVWQLLRRL